MTPSGPAWCLRWPTSVSVDDLAEPFASGVRRLIMALSAAGASVRIAATVRPRERAYLMHFACLVAGYRDADGVFHQISPANVPPMEGVAIDWSHGGDHGAAIAAAVAMVRAYGIAYPAALVSEHTRRLAIDMAMAWEGGLTIHDAAGVARTITSTPRDGTNPELAVVAATFGVIKLRSDAPHWSANGH